LFIRGTQSKYVPDEVLPLIGQFFPRFRLVDVDAGHWLISEQPEAFRRGEHFTVLSLFMVAPAQRKTILTTWVAAPAVVEFLLPQHDMEHGE